MDRGPLNTSHITIDLSFKSSLVLASGTFHRDILRKCYSNIPGVIGTLKCNSNNSESQFVLVMPFLQSDRL